MEFFLQLVVSGFLTGSVYALMALGIVIIYKASSVFNFAHGSIVAFAGYLMWHLLVNLQLSFFFSVLISLVVIAVISFLIQRFILYPLTGQSVLTIIMATLALAEVFSGFITLFWPGPARTYPKFLPSSVFQLGTVFITSEELVNFAICVVAFIIFMFFFRKSKLGLTMRGTAEDHQLARSEGVKVDRIFVLAWFIAIVMAGIGGFLMAHMHGVNQEPLIAMGMKSLTVVILGGMESILGAVIGGLAIGLLEALGAGYLDPLVGGGVEDVFPFIILLAVLLIKPYGLFGYKRIERV
ncbi:MAG: branched-chain amino acid ABC transporter permease [Deltaproteobacteria bacterium]|nr:branched-chain amino acid ABC transporter permease [Deltaproteobacteria bacterium]MBT4091746.1 branched-chain amino acid ABC transporter permease [Deltaproteobacteria bacterium]MBT4265839.1 branched-chain amino acid ABC transporter permease [Deltaproteobacteria bacterium]MBT4637618.1 branched-chain amino acid ABC transporter permease [Deltaproteobacteria bacterium]MBT6503132.1 branched-chain amino acid ABC transporter permease [Deltaproteobacteria bacterium]